MQSMGEFKKTNLRPGDKIIIYGAAMYGELALNALLNIGLEVECFCDKVQGGTEFHGLPVIFPEQLRDYKNAHILICATKGFSSIMSYLEANKIDCQQYYSIGELLSFVNTSDLGIYLKDVNIKDLKEKYNFFVMGEGEGRTLKLPFLGVSITDKCSLKCEKCAALCPYIENPRTMSLELVKKTITKILSCVDTIYELQVSGGEPFLHKELDIILNWCQGQEKIKEIMVLSNATIIPNVKTKEILKNKKIRVILDDYGKLSIKLKELVELFENENIRYTVQKLDAWEELGEIEQRGYSQKETEELFAKCAWHNCLTVVYDSLFRCTRAGICDYIGKIEHDENDYINLLKEVDDIIFSQTLREFLFNKKSHIACGYCNGISTYKATLPVAVQLKK